MIAKSPSEPTSGDIIPKQPKSLQNFKKNRKVVNYYKFKQYLCICNQTNKQEIEKQGFDGKTEIFCVPLGLKENQVFFGSIFKVFFLL
jgi:hypothetical protein